MRIVIGLGGNALLRRGEPVTQQAQQRNLVRAAISLVAVAREHEIVVTHGNGPQVGLLAIQDQAIPGLGGFSLDVLGAETEGMIGYLLAQELRNALPGARVASILTQVEVDPDDAAFRSPSKPVGPMYTRSQADAVAAAKGWSVAADGDGFRRVVPSPRPLRVLEIDTLRLLVEAGTIVICAGGGGIPTMYQGETLVGAEVVIDKDRASAVLACEVGADLLVLATDVSGVFADWGTANHRLIRHATPEQLRAQRFGVGSMGPKVEAAIAFVEETGKSAAIGSLEEIERIVAGEAGTIITRG